MSWQSTPGTPLDKLVSTVGRVHPHVECMVVDPDTREVVPLGVRGELLTRGYGTLEQT